MEKKTPKHTHKDIKIWNSFTTSHGQASIQPSPGGKGTLQLLGKANAIFANVPLLLFSQLYIAEHWVWNIPLVSWGHLS